MRLVQLNMKLIYSIKTSKLRTLLKINLKRGKPIKKEKMKKYMKKQERKYRNNTMIN